MITVQDIQNAKKAKKLTYAEMAKLSGIDRTNIVCCCSGKRYTGPKTMLKLGIGLGLITTFEEVKEQLKMS